MSDWISAGTGISNLVSNIIGNAQSNQQFNKMYQIEKQNLGLQQNTLDWQKALQANIFEREDNSVQRRVADLKAAGLSPVLAAGQGARAGAAIPVTTPQRGTESIKQKAAAQMEFAARNANIARTMAETLLLSKQAKKLDAETAYTSGPKTDLTREQLRNMITKTDYLTTTFEDRVAQQTANMTTAQLNTKIKGYEATLTNIEKNYAESLYKSILSEGIPNGDGTFSVPKDRNPAWIKLNTLRAIQKVKDSQAALIGAEADAFGQSAGGKAGMNYLLQVLRILLNPRNYD